MMKRSVSMINLVRARSLSLSLSYSVFVIVYACAYNVLAR